MSVVRTVQRLRDVGPLVEKEKNKMISEFREDIYSDFTLNENEKIIVKEIQQHVKRHLV